MNIVKAAAIMALGSGLMFGQFNFKIAERDVQVHSFLTQGFAFSDENNFLTMKTTDGSFAMTDGGVNISTQLTDKWRVGAQMYFYNLGELGQGRPQLDWAFVDYKLSRYFGMRAGKVKTVLGLYNDTQDMSFLHTWALMPQSIYPLDLRSQNIAHKGLDLYGNFGLKRMGSLDYTVYAGLGSIDEHGGRYHSATGGGAKMLQADRRTTGADLRWNTPVNGLNVGGSFNLSKERSDSVLLAPPRLLVFGRVNPERIIAAYGEYSLGNWHFAAEVRRDHLVNLARVPLVKPDESVLDNSFTGWYATAAYRVSNWLEVGTYRSQMHGDASYKNPNDPDSKRIFDQAATVRFDVTKFWSVKVEGHFMQGYGDMFAARGFYPADNPAGLKPHTNLLVVRTGWNF